MTNKSKTVIASAVILIVVAVFAYFLMQDTKSDKKSGYDYYVPSENALEKAPDINPVNKTNPFKDIKTNPFE